MERLYITAARLAPALASGLVVAGVAENHAEVIALGLVTAVAALVEYVWRLKNPTKERS